MARSHAFPNSAFDRDAMPLDAARSAFQWLVTGPDPVSVDGSLFPGLPDRRVPVDEVRDRLLRRRCPQTTRDAVWRHLVLRSRTDGGKWTVACVGVALPALTRIAATLTARFADDPADIHAAVLTGFLTELARIDLRKPRVMLRLRWAAYRAGHVAVREALDAPIPSGHGFRSAEPAPPWRHPDFVLARAVADGVINSGEAELIGATRLGGMPLATIAEQRGMRYKAVAMARSRAEHRLVDYLTHAAPADSPSGADHPAAADMVADDAIDAATLTQAARRRQPQQGARHRRSRPGRRTRRAPATRPRQATVPRTGPRLDARNQSPARVWKTAPGTGVQGCGRTPASPTDANSTRPPATHSSGRSSRTS